MNARHLIRLQGPWQLEVRGADLPEGRTSRFRVHVPVDLRQVEGIEASGGLADGAIVLSRVFHAPRTLEPGERVFCVFEGTPGVVQVSVNGHAQGVAEEKRFEIEITEILRQNNLLEMWFAPECLNGDVPCGVTGTVSIQIGRG